MVFGIGLSYKLPVQLSGIGVTLVHPHNIFTDTLRFGGIIGYFLLIQHFLVVGFVFIKNYNLAGKNLFLLVWAISGLMAATFYGQQPFVRPGSYVWFFYWMPITLLYALAIKPLSEDKVVPNNIPHK